MISQDADGHIDIPQLEASLVQYADRPLKIGSFSAASNVTGIVSNTHRVSALLHRHGALSFWDFAAAAPYVEIDMYGGRDRTRWRTRTRSSSARTSSSADPAPRACWSPGGSCCATACPTYRVAAPSRYVNPTEHRYLDDPVHREEGGTPAIIESIRAGLVFQLKQAVGIDVIRAHEDAYLRRAVEAWQRRAEHRDPRQPGRRAAVDRVVRGQGAVGPVPAPQLRGRAAQRPVRDPVPRRLFLRGPVRALAAGHRPRALARVRRGDRCTAARASSPAGSGSTSTTSSPRPSSSTSSRRSSWSPESGWRLLATTASIPRTGCGGTTAGRSSRRCGCPQVGYDADGKLRYPRHDHTAPESALAATTWPRRASCSRPARTAAPTTEGSVNAGVRPPALVRPAVAVPDLSRAGYFEDLAGYFHCLFSASSVSCATVRIGLARVGRLPFSLTALYAGQPDEPAVLPGDLDEVRQHPVALLTELAVT